MKAVIVDLVDQNFVLISGGGISPVKRRRCNIKHIRPLDQMVSIKRGAKDDIDPESNRKGWPCR